MLISRILLGVFGVCSACCMCKESRIVQAKVRAGGEVMRRLKRRKRKSEKASEGGRQEG